MSSSADSFLRLGLVMLREAREQLAVAPQARRRVDGIIAALQTVANKVTSPNTMRRKRGRR